AAIVRRIDGADSNLRLQGTAGVAAALPLLEDDVQMRSCVRVEPLPRQNVCGLPECALMIRLQLNDLLVEGAGLCRGAFVAEAIGNLHELIDGLVDLSRARVQVSERVREIPVS